MSKDFYKQPSFIAAAVALVSYFFLPYVRISAGFVGALSFTGIKISYDGSGIDYLMFLVPVCAAYLIYAAWKETTDYVRFAKIGLLAASGFFVLRYGFIMEGAKVSFIGLGLWLTVLAAIFIMFEEPIMDALNKQKSSGGGSSAN